MSSGRLKIWVALVCLLVGAAGLRAERFLSVDEARRLLFPRADSFEPRQIRFAKEDVAALERRLGARVARKSSEAHYAFEKGQVVGVVFIDQVIGKHELIDYAVAITPTGEVGQIEILEYRESYGGEVRGERWRRQFKGKDSDSKLRLNDDIYNISGATMSCRHVTEGVRRLLATFDLFCRPTLAGLREEHPGARASLR